MSEGTPLQELERESSSSSTVCKMSNEALERLQELEAAEVDVQLILDTASETVAELEKLPACDHNRINGLATEYLDLVLSVKASILRSIGHIENNFDHFNNEVFRQEVISLQDLLADVLRKAE